MTTMTALDDHYEVDEQTIQDNGQGHRGYKSWRLHFSSNGHSQENVLYRLGAQQMLRGMPPGFISHFSRGHLVVYGPGKYEERHQMRERTRLTDYQTEFVKESQMGTIVAVTALLLDACS